ncbi:CaiB/BaiF CoA-transferase family protein [Phenylobacterium sp.]|uniref:CaiB/BaiF CoA transferase family protein n=1 Tax=Phenylobacterium sp. TaxID=1871053 RepID=UPI00301C1E47
MSGPLSGVRIIEFAGIGPGPFCGMMLADHGAEVIRIDRIGAKGLVAAADRDFLNRSRKSFAVDLKATEGIGVVRALCRGADAVFEGFRPGVMERLGLGPEILLEANPRLVYGRMTGWGQTGPYAHAAGHDINYIALSGALHATGRAGQPPTPPMNLVGDFGGGGLMLAFGIVSAILNARATGRGQVVDCAMTEGSAVLMAMIYSLRAQGLWRDERGANLLDSGCHFYDAYETADGGFISIGPVEPQFYALLLQKLELASDEEFRLQNDQVRWPRLKSRLAALFRTRSRAEWCELLEATDVCFAPVMSLDEAPHHPHNVARRAFVSVDGDLQPAPRPRFSSTPSQDPASMRTGLAEVAPILSDLGYDAHRLAELRRRGVLA